MKAHLIKKQAIEDYVRVNARSRSSFEIWLSVLKRVDWTVPEDMVKTFNSIDFLGKGSNRVVFNIGGNSYRLICKYHFGETKVHIFIKWVGTHAEYTRVCNRDQQYEIDIYK